MDPVHQENGEWWFWDETWADRWGPFPTEAAARESLSRYVDHLDGKPRQE
jgi:hypothetical protein